MTFGSSLTFGFNARPRKSLSLSLTACLVLRSLVLLVLEAGIDIDVATLRLIGTRGFIIAAVGSVLPIGMGIIIAILLNGSGDIKAAIAAGASFGPTSLGIALNILRTGGILNTPVGQLIVSAAVIDDMIALIVLSQLKALTGTIDAVGLIVPIVSALAFLLIGGYVALFVIPPNVHKYVLEKFPHEQHGYIEMCIMFSIMFALMPATFYSKASYLMGAFVAGLSFCTSHDLHATFVRQFKRILQWLMRIFFAASIGFQVPIKDFSSGVVLWQGLVFCLALLGKLAVGFLVPNFTQSRPFTGLHLRDCLITGFSMAAEGEFAFVIAVFGVDNGLFDEKMYASVVLAVLLSTIIPPYLLRFTIQYYNKKAEEAVRRLADEEMEKQHNLEPDEDTSTTTAEQLKEDIMNKRAVFLCIQTQSSSRWGLLNDMMKTMARLGLDVIDHRAWHPRGINTTLVNEVYAKDVLNITEKGTSQQLLETRLKEIENALEECISQADAKVKVQRWYPGVVEEIVEKFDEKSKVTGKKVISIEQRLLTEAASKLDQKQALQLAATKERSVKEILAGMNLTDKSGPLDVGEEGVTPMSEEATFRPPVDPGAAATRRAHRRRQKMRSTPVVGGDMFGGMTVEEETKEDLGHVKPSRTRMDFDLGKVSGTRAEIIVEGESYTVRLSPETLKALRTGYSGDMLDSRGVSIQGMSIQPDSTTVVHQLKGYVRNMGTLSKISEETEDENGSHSETSSVTNHSHHRGVAHPKHHDP